MKKLLPILIPIMLISCTDYKKLPKSERHAARERDNWKVAGGAFGLIFLTMVGLSFTVECPKKMDDEYVKNLLSKKAI